MAGRLAQTLEHNIYKTTCSEARDKMKPKIAIIGEYYDTFVPHTALNESLDYLKAKYDFDYEWIETLTVEKYRDEILKGFTGIWSAPGSPFKSLDGALHAITFARLKDVPHLGTCAGFQHAVIELARSILGIKDAQHEEYDTMSSNLFVSRMACSLAGKTMDVFLKKDTLAHKLYGIDRAEENYYCNFGINPTFKSSLIHPQILISGVDQDEEIRIMELPSKRFFIITLFVPQTRSTIEVPHPLIKGFVEAACTI
jgi:CTP synthase (UTP-ammonia lyase)